MIIAEIGTAHCGDIKIAKKLIDAALYAGSDAVKFQFVYADEILHKDTGVVNLPSGKIKLYDSFKKLEVTKEFFLQLSKYAHKKNLKFICSPFGLKSLQELIEIKPDAIKIASPELNHIPLLKYLAQFRAMQKEQNLDCVPVIISSGVSKLSDIEKALEIIGKENVTLLHCITSYPAPENEYNVKLVSTLSNIFGLPCGISDHSLDPVLVPVCATLCGSTTIEKHITLSKSKDGLDDKVALEKEQFAQMVRAVHQCEVAIKRYGATKGKSHILKELQNEYGKKRVLDVFGTGVKELAKSELDNYGKTNRSLHFLHDMKKGETITEKDIAVLRTEKVLTPGISSTYIEEIINAKLTHNVKSGEGVLWKHVIKK